MAADPNIRAHLTPGQEFWYRPRQLLVAPADLGRVMARLTNLGYVVATGAPFAGVARVMFRVNVDIKAIVDDLRNRANWAASVPVVQPHHVVVGYPNIMGNPGDAPASLAVSVAPATGSTGSGQLVGICDTGIWADATKRHPLWFAGSYAAAPADIDELYQGNSTLALQAGHGTFIAGVLRRTAPSIMFDPAVALTPHGIGDEASVAAALASLNPTVSYVNLSLGCYTMGNVPSLPLANAIASLAPRRAWRRWWWPRRAMPDRPGPPGRRRYRVSSRSRRCARTPCSARCRPNTATSDPGSTCVPSADIKDRTSPVCSPRPTRDHCPSTVSQPGTEPRSRFRTPSARWPSWSPTSASARRPPPPRCASDPSRTPDTAP
ncbi:hypothetical protein NKG94_16680 [Micromonospora sp. M12]